MARRGARDHLRLIRLLRLESCPKCGGQYRRDGLECHCYQCAFEWEVTEPLDRVLARARRRIQPERPVYRFWDEEEEQGPGGMGHGGAGDQEMGSA